MLGNMTIPKFYNYLISLGLFKIKIWIDETGINAIINKEPFQGDFSQIKSLGDGFYEVKLSKSDYQTQIITAGFFNN